MNYKEIIEDEVLHRSDALVEIAELVERYVITGADLATALPVLLHAESVDSDRPKAKLFHPFSDIR